jgi:hypothetical protein
MEAAFDLTRDFPALNYPTRSGVDVGVVKSLLVEAAKAVADIKEVMDDPTVDPINLKFAKFNIAIFNLLEAAVEKGIVPIAAAPASAQDATQTEVRGKAAQRCSRGGRKDGRHVRGGLGHPTRCE